MSKIKEVNTYRKIAIKEIENCIKILDDIYENIEFFLKTKLTKRLIKSFTFKNKYEVFFFEGEMFVLIPFYSNKAIRTYAHEKENVFLSSSFLRLGSGKPIDVFDAFFSRLLRKDKKIYLTSSNELFNEGFSSNYNDLEIIEIMKHFSKMVEDFSNFDEVFLTSIGYSKLEINAIHRLYSTAFKELNVNFSKKENTDDSSKKTLKI